MDQSLPTQERIDAAIKRVKKMIASAKASIAPPGSVKPKLEQNPYKVGNQRTGPKGGWGKLLQQQLQQQQPNMPPGYGNF